jgi:hypothetical protein
MVVGNNPFQVAWLSKTTQDNYLSEIAAVNKEVVLKHEPMIVFEGNVPAEISNNANLLKSAQNADGQVPQAWLGEPVTIKSPTAVAFARHNGSNLLVTGQQDLAMAGVFNSVLVSLMVRCGSDVGKITVLDGNSADSMVSMKLRKIDSAFGHKCRFAHPNDAGPVLAEIAAEVRARVESSSQNASSEFLIISPLQRFRSLYRKDDDWSFKADEKGPSNDKLLAEILREGPAVGIHVIVGVDNFNTIEKFIDRQTLREFNYRVLFQMSASDSSNLIDSPVANQLGFQRALLYNEEQGLLEKFRFYAPPEDEWLSKIAKKV